MPTRLIFSTHLEVSWLVFDPPRFINLVRAWEAKRFPARASKFATSLWIPWRVESSEILRSLWILKLLLQEAIWQFNVRFNNDFEYSHMLYHMAWELAYLEGKTAWADGKNTMVSNNFHVKALGDLQRLQAKNLISFLSEW